jgi:hypothetical protein
MHVVQEDVPQCFDVVSRNAERSADVSSLELVVVAAVHHHNRVEIASIFALQQALERMSTDAVEFR